MQNSQRFPGFCPWTPLGRAYSEGFWRVKLVEKPAPSKNCWIWHCLVPVFWIVQKIPENYGEVGQSWLIFRVFLIHLFTTCKYNLMALNLRHSANGLCDEYDMFSCKNADININDIWKQITSPHPNGAKLFRKILVHSVRLQTRFYDNWSHCIKSNI